MRFVLNEYKQSLNDEEILLDIKDTAQRLRTEYLSFLAYKKHGKYSQSAIQNHFGSWRNALKLAGLRSERNKDEYSIISDDDYIRDFQRVAEMIGEKTVTYENYTKYGKYSSSYIFKRFGLWDNILVKAGLNPTGMARHKISEQDLFEEIERIWILLGKQPTSTDIIKLGISKYSIDTYKRRFGGWRKALEAFVLWVNTGGEVSDDENLVSDVKVCNYRITENEEKLAKKAHTTSRNINLRLRFKVMHRDDFSCVLCGASPAKSKNVILHVDHIVPWAKGGETVLDNLQTLCEKCNLGKGDIEI